MKKCILILPYFGKFNNYFPLFLRTCEKNTDIDFLIITDNTELYNYPSNVYILHMTFDEFKAMAAKKLGFDPCLPTPYKLCDFKPSYGFLFEEYISDYNFWGHCDCDLVFGNLNRLLIPLLDKGYDKLFAAGHLVIYKNSFHNNRLFMNSHNGKNLYKDVFTSPRIWGFDEAQCDRDMNNVHEIFRSAGAKMFVQDLSMNAFVGKDALVSCNYNDATRDYEVQKYVPARYYWCSGSLYSLSVNTDAKDSEVDITEYLYMHLQSRKMRLTKDILSSSIFEITPDAFKKREYMPKSKKQMKLWELKIPSRFWFDVYIKKIKNKLRNLKR